MDLLDLDSLRCFTTAADTLNFRAAAKRVSLSPGAFSDRIRRLEEDLGTALFHRTTRRTRLTEAGTRLLPNARTLLAEAQRCRNVVAEDAAPLPFELVIGTRFELGIVWLTPILKALESAVPERTVHLYMADTPDLTHRVLRGDIDAVIYSARLTSASLRYATLHTEEYVFVGNAPLVTGPDDAPHCRLLDVSADLPLFRYFLDAWPGKASWRFGRHQYLGGIGGLRMRVLEGAGVAVLPRYFVQADLDCGTLVELMPEVKLKSDAFRLVWRTAHPQDAALQALAEELRTHPLLEQGGHPS
ncbi:MAG: LysR family transcriptional regulator [Rhodobacterales bacterium]|nr:LysR family transcriptional regulator [Rhodobacterales bacterium]